MPVVVYTVHKVMSTSNTMEIVDNALFHTQAYVSGLLGPVVDRVLNFEQNNMSHFDM